MMQQVKKLKEELAELKCPRESSRASFADACNASNSYNDLLLGVQKQAEELEELKCQLAARSPGAPAVVALQDLRSVFENFVPAAGTGDKENRGASGWNCYLSMEPHHVCYVYRDDPEDLGLAIRRSTSLLHTGANTEPGLRV